MSQPRLRDLIVILPTLGRVRLRYSACTAARGHRRFYWYFLDRRLEGRASTEEAKAAIERACHADDLRYFDDRGEAA